MPNVLWTLMGLPPHHGTYETVVHTAPGWRSPGGLAFSWQAIDAWCAVRGIPFETLLFTGTTTSAWHLTLNPLLDANREDLLALALELGESAPKAVTRELLDRLEIALSTANRAVRCVCINGVEAPGDLATAYAAVSARLPPDAHVALDITHGRRSHAFFVQEALASLLSEGRIRSILGPYYGELQHSPREVAIVDMSAVADFAARREALRAHEESGRLMPLMRWIEVALPEQIKTFQQLSHAWDSNDMQVIEQRASQLVGCHEQLASLPVLGVAIVEFLDSCRGARWKIEQRRATIAAGRSDWITAFMMLREAATSKSCSDWNEMADNAQIRERHPVLDSNERKEDWDNLRGVRNRVVHGVAAAGENRKYIEQHRDPVRMKRLFDELNARLLG